MAHLTDKEREPIEAAIFAGHKIEAIKIYRGAVPGTGLAEAKSTVEAMETQLRAAHPEKFTASTKKSGCLGVMASITLVLAAAALMVLFTFAR